MSTVSVRNTYKKPQVSLTVFYILISLFPKPCVLLIAYPPRHTGTL